MIIALLGVTASLIPAAATYAWVESPIRFSKRLQRVPQRVLAGAAIAAVAAIGLAAMSANIADALRAARFAPMLAARSELPRVYGDKCHVFHAALSSPECVYGALGSDTTIVLFGDSHAAQWFPALDSIAAVRQWRARVPNQGRLCAGASSRLQRRTRALVR